MTQLTKGIEKAAATGPSPFAKIEAMLGPKPGENPADGTVVSVTMALKNSK